MRTKSCASSVTFFLLVMIGGTHGQASGPRDDVAATADPGVRSGILEFRIEDASGGLIPGRLTFVPDGDAPTPLFSNADARPDDLAVRKNVVYCLSGRSRITVPVGDYVVYASRGLEWSLDRRPLSILDGETVAWTARLEHELDTSGWISGDFHLHTLTYSGHGDSNMNERIISLVGEGVEFAVATDHNHHTDYGPTIDHLHAGDAITAVTGNEVSVPVGHFNAFPLDPAQPPVDAGLRDANELFRQLREHRSPFGIVPVIQVNHPRWSGIDYFAIGELDPVTGTAASADYSDDFDTIEVLNENTGWGYYQPFVDGVPTASNDHSVVRDWFNLLNRGHRYAAVGNSDSHTVHYAFAGYPRNFVRSAADTVAAIDPVAIATALRERAVFTTTGPFVELLVNGVAMGGRVPAPDGSVDVSIRVQAASWIDVDRVKIVVDGDVVETMVVPETRDVRRARLERSIHMEHDGWIAVLVEGDDVLAPIIDAQARPVRPLAVVNPVWVDVDHDGVWTSPWARLKAEVESSATRDELDARRPGDRPPSERGLLVLAAAESGRPYVTDLVREGLEDEDRLVRLRALRAAERLADPSLRPALERVLEETTGDPYTKIAALRALGPIDRDLGRTIVAFLEREGSALPGRYRSELMPALPGGFVTEWFAVGYFEAPEAGAASRSAFGPETNADIRKVYDGAKNGRAAGWRPVTAGPSGFVDLLALESDPALGQNALAFAQTWLHATRQRDVAIALGTDDGACVRLNGEIVYESAERRGAQPLQHVTTWRLRRGWNRVLFAVENGTGSFGLYLRVLDDDVKRAAAPR